MTPNLKRGAKVKFAGEVQRYTIQASNDQFAVCTKPFNAQKTVLYTVMWFEKSVRGTENLIFGMGAETQEQCEEMLERLSTGQSKISGRNCVALEIESIDSPRDQIGV